MPTIDAGARQRLTTRYGDQAQAWLDALPDLLAAVAARWQVRIGEQIPRGSTSVVFHCRTADGRAAVLKAGPDHGRLAAEAAALNGWHTAHTPAVLDFDTSRGVLLIEAITPGTPLAAYPDEARIADLLAALHRSGVPDPSYPSLEQRVAALFDSSARLYEVYPQVRSLVPRELYEGGRRAATRLAQDTAPDVLLHGDLTPSNILDGGPGRGLVAIDPAACLGDAAFDTVDLIFWQADDLATINARVERYADTMDADRILQWCRAFAGMVALEMASNGEGHLPRFDTLRNLA